MSVGSLILLFICVAIMVGVVVAFLLPQKDGLLPEEKVTEVKFSAEATVTKPEEESEK